MSGGEVGSKVETEVESAKPILLVVHVVKNSIKSRLNTN